MKQPRKVALINVADCPRQDYDAYWQITVDGNDAEGWHWRAKLLSYKPLGYEWAGKVHKEWPEGVPAPAYPSDAHLARDAEFKRMTPEEQAAERARQALFRAQCAAIYEASPKAIHLIEETVGAEETKDKADGAAQEWVREKIRGRRKDRNQASIKGYAIPLPVDALGAAVRDVFDELRYRWRKHVAPLLAIAYSTTIRNNRMAQVRDAIDGGAGAGLMRIYDGSRPATCGTATTLLAELTHSDPCAGSPSSGALTFSAITADASANATGTATWYRDVDSTGTCCVDGSVGTSGSDLNLNSTSISTGQQVSCTSKVYTEGSA